MAVMLDASQEWLCCDNPDLVTKYSPKVACRTCGEIWDEYTTSSKPPHPDVVVAAELPWIA